MINVEAPINSVSFGQVTTNILYKLYKEGNLENINLFPIGENVDFQSFDYSREFQENIAKIAEDRFHKYKSSDNTYKLWHINGAQNRVGEQSLITFHETDSLTKEEVQILNSQKEVFVSSKYTKQIFEDHGVKNVNYWPLWFDDFHFKKIETRPKKYTSFGIFGKLEKRKGHVRAIKAWVKAFGGDKNYRLNCCINNPFLVKAPPNADPQDVLLQTTQKTKEMIQGSLQQDGLELPWNVNFLNSELKNSNYNRILNNTDIVIGMSHCEGFDLPLFQCLNLGKKAVVFDSHVHRDYCDENNSILISENGKKIDAHDGLFFNKGQKFNQGQWADWDEDDLIEGLRNSVTKEFKGRDLANEFEFHNIFK